TAERVPATAHLFIVNPLTGQGMDNLFSTHPSTENRIAALERLAAEIRADGLQRTAPNLPEALGKSLGQRGQPRWNSWPLELIISGSLPLGSNKDNVGL